MGASITEADMERVDAALHEVYDPEVGLDIVTMGLIYRVEAGMEKVIIDMTLTTPGCPVSDSLPEEARQAAARALDPGGDERVNLEIVWDPPWNPEMIDDDALADLGYRRVTD
ncbi:MAG TPA: iron-sulfur cluster assembly protein [Acidimicrobiales bacterium]|nr:iron-sulfur cluster assembly protein [Acidimicrobiales bacterium]